MGMKPIFEEERLFFKEKSGVELPTDCWRSGNKIYLDIYCKTQLYSFKVEDGKIKITKNNEKLFECHNQVKIKDIIKIEEQRVNLLYNESLDFLYKYLFKNKDTPIVFNHSGGKDSCLSYELFKNIKEKLLKEGVVLDYTISFANTSNDTADTYKFIKDNNNIEQEKLKIMNPKEGFYNMIKRKNYFVSTVLSRECCGVYKEGQIRKQYDINKKYIMILGVRKFESTKRSKYDWIMDDSFYIKLFGKKNTNPKLWVNIAPIINWKDEDVWIYLIKEKIKLNEQYKKGYNRCGCLICPFQSEYIDLLTENQYPIIWKRWINNILPKSYKNGLIEERFKWTINEYIGGAWKKGTSKIYEITSKKPTNERVFEIMKLMNIDDYELAKKYFNKTCYKCNKKLNPSEIGMNLKMIGRSMDIDNKALCKKCMCKDFNIDTKEYSLKLQSFRESGCSLF